MSRYDATEDPLCYTGTHVLKNRAGLQNQDDLDQFEQLMFLTRSEEPLPHGDLDYDHYKRIHHHFFQDVYDWAGQSREIRTAKGGNWFCYPEYVDPEIERLFSQLARENHPVSVMYFSTEPIVTVPWPDCSITQLPSHSRSWGQIRPQISGKAFVS